MTDNIHNDHTYDLPLYDNLIIKRFFFKILQCSNIILLLGPTQIVLSELNVTLQVCQAHGLQHTSLQRAGMEPLRHNYPYKGN